MLSEKQYIQASEDFGTSVGVAHAISKKWIKEFEDKEDARNYTEENLINSIVLRCIERGEYQTLQRKIYQIRLKMGKRKLKEVTIYKKAWYYIVNGHDKRNNTKSGEILHQIG